MNFKFMSQRFDTDPQYGALSGITGEANLIQERQMVTNPEQFVAVQKGYLKALFDVSGKALEGVEKLLDLNMQLVKTTLTERQENAQSLLSAKDPQSLLAWQSSVVQPSADKALSYARHVYDIVASTQAELVRASEAQCEEMNRRLQAMAESLGSNAPAGSETMAALLKSGIATANSTRDTVYKAAKQAVEMAESNLSAAASMATKAA